MKDRNKGRTAVFILVTLVVLLIAVWAYVMQLSRMTESSMLTFMEELSRHDMQNIESELNRSWDEIKSVYTRVQVSRCDTIQEVCSRLNVEQTTNTFDLIYLVDSDGNTYAGTNTVQESRDKEYIQPLISGRDKFVMRYNDKDILETMRENLVYGIQCDPFLVNGVEFIGIVGFTRINMIEKRLKIDSFDGRGNTSIIDASGNYVVNRKRSAGIGKIDNYFERLRDKAGLSENEIREITARFNQGEAFIEHFKLKDEESQVVSFIPISGTSWNIVLTVSETVFKEQTQQFVTMTGVMLAVIVAALCLMMFIILHMSATSAEAKAEAKARGEFLSNMSHEIRTPLNGIIGLNHLMQQNTDNPSKLKEYLDKSDSTAKYLLSLVNDILDMSKLQAGKVEVVYKPFSLRHLISMVESVIRSRAEDKHIIFQIETDMFAPGIIGDETRMEQILINILGNAVKFTPEGGHITFRISQAAAGNGKVTTTFEVEDTGCGMSEEFQKKIFDSFSQEHSTTSAGMQGTGLGMAISRQLAKQMGAALSVRSKQGEGSCFSFVITAETVEEIQEAATDGAVECVDEDKARKLKILIAEDNELNAEIIIEMLVSAGFTVLRAVNGEQVVEMFQASALYEFGVILMDVQMPVKNGYEAAKAIRALERPDAKTITIYACTANTFKEDQDNVLESGMNGFIGKPIDVRTLMQMLNKVK